VSVVARRHESSAQHLFAWRKAARRGQLAVPADEAVVFVPVMMAAQKPEADCDDAIDHDRDGWDRGSGTESAHPTFRTRLLTQRSNTDAVPSEPVANQVTSIMSAFPTRRYHEKICH
jgi:transposase-like protein